jgi:hypothetical protein
MFAPNKRTQQALIKSEPASNLLFGYCFYDLPVNKFMALGVQPRRSLDIGYSTLAS